MPGNGFLPPTTCQVPTTREETEREIFHHMSQNAHNASRHEEGWRRRVAQADDGLDKTPQQPPSKRRRKRSKRREKEAGQPDEADTTTAAPEGLGFPTSRFGMSLSHALDNARPAAGNRQQPVLRDGLNSRAQAAEILRHGGSSFMM